MSEFIIAHPRYNDLRLTIAAREALESAGNVCAQTTNSVLGYALFTVQLQRPPKGIVMCLIGHGDDQHHGLRLEDEPKFPGEFPATSGAIAWHEHGQWVPCPKCGAALVWFEAGFVPGYRICLNHHHAQLSRDGRSAEVVR